jgi:competence protein CoiA
MQRTPAIDLWGVIAVLRYAEVDGEKSLPFPGGRGLCPTCRGAVIAKCGHINTRHWAHEVAEECDSWSEGIGPWHISWQDIVRPEFVEVAMGQHRADMIGDGRVVIELQHSPINPEEIEERERFYKRMIWLFDATCRFAGIHSGERFFFV